MLLCKVIRYDAPSILMIIGQVMTINGPVHTDDYQWPGAYTWTHSHSHTHTHTHTYTHTHKQTNKQTNTHTNMLRYVHQSVFVVFYRQLEVAGNMMTTTQTWSLAS